jgi:PAS domain S-box-containing protein
MRTLGFDIDRTRLLTAVVESSGDAIYALSHDGHVATWNPAAERLYGRSEAEMIGGTIDIFMVPDEAERLRQVLHDLRVPSQVLRIEAVHQARDGGAIDVGLSLSPVRTAGDEPIAVAVIARDITSRKIEDEQLRLAMDANPLGLIITDEAGRIRLINGTTEAIFGYRREELIGEKVEMLMPMDRRQHHEELRGVYAAHPHFRALDATRAIVGLRKDGTRFPAEIALTPLTGRQGPMVMACVTDITAREAAAAADLRQRRELQRSNQELAQFAYVASHDLQEPLRMVASYTQLLAERYKGQLDERADKYIRYAVEGATRMQRLVSDLLAISRVDSQARTPRAVDASGVLRRVLADMAGAVTASKAEIVCDGLPVVLADEVQLGQLFQNLLTNALKFVSDRPPCVRVSAVPERAMWRFAVEDNGIGIEAEYAERVFEMFQRLHARGQYEGNGIGLALAKKIVERHHGRIWLESTPGIGTTFYFTLPVPAAA